MAGELVQVRESRRAFEVCEIDLVAELVDLYDSVPESLVEGAERLVPSGHDGTPLFAEFLTVELAPLLQSSIPATRELIADVLDLRERLPRTWEALHRGAIQVWQARRIAQLTSLLDRASCLWVDAALFPCLGRVAWPRILRKLGGLIVEADPAGAAARADGKRSETFVRVWHEGEGISTLHARLRTEQALVLANAVELLAQQKVTDGACGPLDALLAEALTDLALPTDAADGRPGLPRPVATVVVHVTPDGELARPELVGKAAGRGEGEIGPLLRDQVRELLQHHRVRVLPVIDLAGDPAVDAYEVPAGIWRHVVVRDGCEVFPYSSRPATTCQMDHTREWYAERGPGQTRPSNLGPLSALVHRARTHGGWEYEQVHPGWFSLVSPLGYEYEVTRQGTRHPRVTEHIAPCEIVVGIDFTPRRDLPTPPSRTA